MQEHPVSPSVTIGLVVGPEDPGEPCNHDPPHEKEEPKNKRSFVARKSISNTPTGWANLI